MSKETAIILLGVLNVVIATNLLAIPGSWKDDLLILAGIALIFIGFLLRRATLSHIAKHSPHHPFVENLPDRQAGEIEAISYHPHEHEQKEGITSLN